MTITSQTTRQGKVIHLLSPGDLGDAVESRGGGGRLRAYCPIHGGDHQRSLSIDPETGWGFCHCCHATVLVTSTGSRLVGGRAYAHAQCNASRRGTSTNAAFLWLLRGPAALVTSRAPSGSKRQPSGDHFSHAGSGASSSRWVLPRGRASSGARC